MIANKTNNNSWNIRSAIDNLLRCNAVYTKSNPVKLTECSSEVKVIFNKMGGICTKCNVMFESKISLTSHLNKCGAYKGLDEKYDKKYDNYFVEKTFDQIPQLLIMTE